MAKKKTAEEIAEENVRTNEVGLFNFADAYLLCAKHAKQLVDNRPRQLRFPEPIHFLLFHAAELYVKSYLRQKGEDVAALVKLGHYYAPMCEKAATYGLNLPPEIYDIFKLLDQTHAVIESRYIVTCLGKPIDTNKLLALVEAVRANVKISHKAAGVKLGATRALP
jgi:hypothetical protein